MGRYVLSAVTQPLPRHYGPEQVILRLLLEVRERKKPILAMGGICRHVSVP